MDHGCEALIGFAGTHGDALELLEFAEEVLDQVAPFVHLGVDLEPLGAVWMLRNDDFCPALIELLDNPVGIKGLIAKQGVKVDAVNQRRNTDGVVAVSRQELEAYEIAQGIGQRQNCARPSTRTILIAS